MLQLGRQMMDRHQQPQQGQLCTVAYANPLLAGYKEAVMIQVLLTKVNKHTQDFCGRLPVEKRLWTQAAADACRRLYTKGLGSDIP